VRSLRYGKKELLLDNVKSASVATITNPVNALTEVMGETSVFKAATVLAHRCEPNNSRKARTGWKRDQGMQIQWI